MKNATKTNSNKAMTGESAINYAELHSLMLSKYADPIEGHRADLSPDEAREIMREDPSLIYLEVNAYHQPTGPKTKDPLAPLHVPRHKSKTREKEMSKEQDQ